MIAYPKNRALGALDVKGFPKVQYEKIVEIIDAINDLNDGDVTMVDLNLTGDLDVAGASTMHGNLDLDGNAIVNIADITVTGAVDAVKIKLDDGLVTDLAVQIGADFNNGLYGVSDTQLGIAVEGVLVAGADTNGLFTSTISEQVGGVGVTIDSTLLKDGLVVTKATPVAINSTAAATAAQMVSGYITSTSAAATAITTPTATAIAALIGAVQGTSFDLVIDNSAGANTVTLTLDASIAVVTPAITGGDTLTVSTANAVGIFRIVFTSGTAAKIFRIA